MKRLLKWIEKYDWEIPGWISLIIGLLIIVGFWYLLVEFILAI